MPSVQLQFHVDPEEAVSLALRWAREYGLTAVVEQFFPDYRAIVAEEGEASSIPASRQGIRRVALCGTDPNVTAPTPHEFTKRNSDCLFFSIGSREDDGLRESALGGVTDDQDTLRTWRRLVRAAKSSMHLSGATVRNPFGDESRLPKHLHTPGAHELARQGVRMLAAAGWVGFEFDDLR